LPLENTVISYRYSAAKSSGSVSNQRTRRSHDCALLIMVLSRAIPCLGPWSQAAKVHDYLPRNPYKNVFAALTCLG
jgi:hypothetical protein